jgi:hypothetical protein
MQPMAPAYPIKFRVLMWLDRWWAHKLKLPGGERVCHAFECYLWGGEENVPAARR